MYSIYIHIIYTHITQQILHRGCSMFALSRSLLCKWPPRAISLLESAEAGVCAGFLRRYKLVL